MEPNQNHKINSRSVVQQTMDYITDSIIRVPRAPSCVPVSPSPSSIPCSTASF